MASLVLADGSKHRFSLGPQAEIGRSPECDVVISDASISRRHARLQRREASYWLVDLQSRYGCFVNDQPVHEVALKHGDKLRLGNVVLQFEDLGSDERADAQPQGNLLGGPARDSSMSGASATRIRELEQTVAQLEGKVAELSRIERKNQVLLEVGRLTSFNFDPGVLLEYACDAVLRAMRADRCAVLQLDGGMLVPRTLRNLPAGLPPERWGLVSKALQQRSIHIAKAGVDGREGVAAPMAGKQGQPLGAIYLDLPPGRSLERDEQDLFLGIAAQVALALDNALLLETIRGEEKKRERLSRYVSDKVVDAILHGKMNLELGGEHREVTVMFVDIRGFTSLSERLQPADVLSMLNEYFSATTEAVFAVEGTVDKYIGDALMAVFGAPQAYPDHALRAVRAAVEIRRLVGTLRDQWQGRPWSGPPDGPGFNVGIGVNSGVVVAGNIGSQRRMEYTVIGDTVNLASRLCSNAARGQVLIGPETFAAVGGQIQARALAPLKVKGKEQPVQAWEVL